MLARTITTTPWGIEARPVQVEVDVHFGLPQMQIVGLADAAVRESRERVRAAVKNCGYDLSPMSVIINLAPADLRKEGNPPARATPPPPRAATGKTREEPPAGRLLWGGRGLEEPTPPAR